MNLQNLKQFFAAFPGQIAGFWTQLTFAKRMTIAGAIGIVIFAIVALFVCESLIVAFMGGALGIFLGFKIMTFIFNMTSIQAFVPELSLIFIIKIVGMLLASALFAGLVPAWITLNANPVEVIRGE